MIKKNVLTQEQIAEKLDYLRKQRDGLIVGDYRNYLYNLYMYLKERCSETRMAAAIHIHGKCSSPSAEMTFTNHILDTPTVTILNHLGISGCKDTARIKRFLSQKILIFNPLQ